MGSVEQKPNLNSCKQGLPPGVAALEASPDKVGTQQFHLSPLVQPAAPPRRISAPTHPSSRRTMVPPGTDTASAIHTRRVLATLYAIWRWRTTADTPDEIWPARHALNYHAAGLKASLHSLQWKRTPTSAASSHTAAASHILRAVLGDDAPSDPPAAARGPHRYVLFFDGGSRGNPGPVGSGSVIVRTDLNGLCAQIIWSAAMSSAHVGTTNNQAEYTGALTWLRTAPLKVVGDSQLVLGQLRHHRSHQNAKLRLLYTGA